MKRKALHSYEKIPAVDGTVCRGCREAIEISLLVPPKTRGGNRRRFKRYYQCENCTRIFCRYDFVYALIFLVSPKRIAEYLFTSPRSRLRANELESQANPRYRGQFRPVNYSEKKARQAHDQESDPGTEAEATSPSPPKQARHLV